MSVVLPSASQILAHLPASLQHIHVEVYPTIDSTNTPARRMLAEGQIHSPTLLIALTQTAGRGRMGREFFSPAGSGLYMTLIHPLPSPTHHITPAAAVAVCQATREVMGISLGIKWVNDLYLDGKKVGGILTECVQDPQGHPYVLAGIGVNITTQAFPSGLRQPASSLLTPNMVACRDYDLSLMAARIVTHLIALWQSPEACLANYRRELCLTGRTVTYAYVCAPDGDTTLPPCVTGVVEGVDDNFSLLLRQSDGQLLTLGSGEVTSVHIS